MRLKKAVYKAAKKQAIEKDTSLQDIVNSALLSYLSQQAVLEGREKPNFNDRQLGYRLDRPLRRKDLYQ